MIKAVIFDMFETLITHYSSPVYFGAQMAEDAGISEEIFQSVWSPTEHERTIGNLRFEEVIEHILKENHCFSELLLNKIVEKRIAAKEECFHQLHNEIIPMLTDLKSRGAQIGLISNCFSEEATVIRSSNLFPYFDVVSLSCEKGLSKPDEAIFYGCLEELSCTPEECLYVGDGGSEELETARKIGMKAVQAVWYLKEGTKQPVGRKPDFWQVERPLDLVNFLEK